MLEEKAKRFMAGADITLDLSPWSPSAPIDDGKMTKERFDTIVGAFIEKHRNIKKIDFTRDQNGLPSITYHKYEQRNIPNAKYGQYTEEMMSIFADFSVLRHL